MHITYIQSDSIVKPTEQEIYFTAGENNNYILNNLEIVDEALLHVSHPIVFISFLNLK